MNKDVVYLPEKKIKDAAAEFETPFFLYEERRIRENARRLKGAFEKYFNDFWPLFAVKTNPNPEIVKILMEEGFGVDSSSMAEAWLAKKLNVKGMHTSNYTSPKEFEMAKDAGLILNLDDISMIPTVHEIGMPETISFRINPGIGRGGPESESLVFAGPDAKYGLPFESASAAYARAKEMGAKHFGIHMMTGSNVNDEKYFSIIVEKLLNIVAQIKKDCGIEIEFMNIGGGFGVPYEPDEESLDIEKIAKNLREIMDRKCAEQGISEPRLLVEPGRFITADAGWLVGKVLVIKDSYKKFVGIDASANDLPRPSIYGAYHYVSVLNDSDEQEVVSIVGSICENNDQFAKDRELKKCEIGDLVVIHNSGGHAHSMGHNYNGKPRHAEYLLEENGNFRQIRRAETIEDIFKTVDL